MTSIDGELCGEMRNGPGATSGETYTFLINPRQSDLQAASILVYSLLYRVLGI